MSDERLRELERLVATGEAPPERLEYERWRRSVPSDLGAVVVKVGLDLVRSSPILHQALSTARMRRMSGEEFLVLAVQALSASNDRLSEMAMRLLSERSQTQWMDEAVEWAVTGLRASAPAPCARSESDHE